MALGDTLRRITLQDQLILDTSGNVLGIKSPNANGSDLRFDPNNAVIAGGSIGGEVITNTSGLVKKLRRTVPRALDVFSPAGYMQAPSAWVAGATYKRGEMVANSGNWYVCNLGGVAAGSGGPTGTGDAEITDNTAKWFFFSKPLVTTALVDTPTLSVQAGGTVAGLTNAYAAVGNQGVLFKSTDALYYEVSGNNLMAQNGGISSGSTQPANGAWEFMTDAPKVAFKTSDYISSLRILVSTQGGPDVSVTVGDYPLGAPSTNADYWTIIDFASVRRARKITVVGAGAMRGVSVDPASTVWAAPAQLVRMLWIGDSYGAGSAGGPARISDHWPHMVAKYLGIGQGLIDFSAGGTGWLNPSGATYNYLDRINAAATQIAAANLDIVVLQGTNNDSSFTDAQVSAQYLAVLQRMRVLQPKALIVMTGPWTGTVPAVATRMNGLLKAAFAAWGDSNSLFVPTQSDDPEGVAWSYGTGNSSSPNGTGNNDAYLYSDATHLTVRGLYYFARRFTDAFTNLLSV